MISFHPTAKIPETPERGFKPSFHIKKSMLGAIWSPILWADGRRKSEKFMYADYAVLDFDRGELSLAEAVRLWADSKHLIGTTRSHQLPKDGLPPRDRFRVAIPWEKRISDAKIYRYNMEKLTERWPADSSCKDCARLFFPCREIVSQSDSGYGMSVLQPPIGYGAPPAPIPDAVRGKGILPWYLKNMLKKGAAPGTIRATYFKWGAECHKWGFTLGEAVEMVAKSRIGEHATAADPLREMYDCVSDGWKKDAGRQRE
jgi:hypothetical protein